MDETGLNHPEKITLRTIDAAVAVWLFDWSWQEDAKGNQRLTPSEEYKHKNKPEFDSDGIPLSLPHFTTARITLRTIMKGLSTATDGADWEFKFVHIKAGTVCILTGVAGKQITAEGASSPLAACLVSIEAAGGPRFESKDIQPE